MRPKNKQTGNSHIWAMNRVLRLLVWLIKLVNNKTANKKEPKPCQQTRTSQRLSPGQPPRAPKLHIINDIKSLSGISRAIKTDEAQMKPVCGFTCGAVLERAEYEPTLSLSVWIRGLLFWHSSGGGRRGYISSSWRWMGGIVTRFYPRIWRMSSLSRVVSSLASSCVSSLVKYLSFSFCFSPYLSLPHAFPHSQID